MRVLCVRHSGSLSELARAENCSPAPRAFHLSDRTQGLRYNGRDMLRRVMLSFVAIVVLLIQLSAQRAVPIDPVSAILDALQSHAVVALSEGDHGNKPGFEFRLALIRDARFTQIVDDVVVESGNALYQGTMDRFVQGEDVPYSELRRVWENTTQPFATFDAPIYKQFFEAIRGLNRTLPRDRRLRVLLGDPPIDWDRVRTKADVGKWLAERDRFPADLIRREVIAKRRRALVVYGGMHLQRRNISFNYSDSDGLTIVGLLEREKPVIKVFNIWTATGVDLGTVQDTTDWRVPSLVRTRDTPFGEKDFTFYYPFDDHRVHTQAGALVTVPRDEWQTRRMADQFDAILYLGVPSTITDEPTVSPDLCRDSAYVKMRTERFLLLGLSASADRLKKDCAALNQRR